ncbi:MAG TPA: cation diffusion facilitator family transporter [Kofleriaceae bacterium]|nr:cation diffusion facilitator family transporter [Kofleriaceae bacterium]
MAGEKAEGAGHGAGHIIQSLVANLLIALSKGVAAAFTGSGALLAETLHSLADCGNQLLLLLGVNRARQPPTPAHPLGFGRVLYFWSFMVALLLFTGGGVFSLYEGIHKFRHPEPVGTLWLGMVILAVSLLIEGWATLGNIRDMNRRRGARPFLRYIRETKDSDLVVIFGENSAAVVGLVFAMLALVAASVTGDGRWDAAGSMAIGAVLVVVAVFLAVEVKSLLVGESADPEVELIARELVAADPRLVEMINCITIQQGPGEVLVALKIRFQSELTADGVSRAIDEFERRLRERAPCVRWSFVEPDLKVQARAA